MRYPVARLALIVALNDEVDFLPGVLDADFAFYYLRVNALQKLWDYLSIFILIIISYFSLR